MFEILSKEALNPTVVRIAVSAPRIARKAEPGQFVILRAKEQSERIPLTVADYDREAGTVTVIYQIVGAGTMELNTLNAGDCLHDLVGPLGTPTRTEGLKKVCIVGGGVGCAIAYPVAKKLHGLGCTVHSVVGFRSRDLVILEDEFRGVSEEVEHAPDSETQLRAHEKDTYLVIRLPTTAATAKRGWSPTHWKSSFRPATNMIR